MTDVVLMLLVTLASTGIIRVIILYLLQKFLKQPNRWKTANILTALLRTLSALPQVWGGNNIFSGLLFLFVVYLLEQVIWFIYDYIQQRRNNTPAGWGMIWGVIIGGVIWLIIIRALTTIISKMIIG